jgi:hypothetical protein
LFYIKNHPAFHNEGWTNETKKIIKKKHLENNGSITHRYPSGALDYSPCATYLINSFLITP